MMSEAPGHSGGEAVYESVLPPPLPIAPPTMPGAMAKPPQRAVWPTPIGIIAIVFGAGGVMFSLWSAVVPWVFSSFESWTNYTPNTAMATNPFASLRRWAVAMSVVHGLGSLVAVALLTGGIGLLQRKVWGERMLFWWAVVRIPLAFVVTAVTALQQQEQMMGMAGQAGGAAVGAVMGGFVWFGAILSIAWYCAFPTFMVIWLTRGKVRAEVRTWGVRQVRQG